MQHYYLENIFRGRFVDKYLKLVNELKRWSEKALILDRKCIEKSFSSTYKALRYTHTIGGDFEKKNKFDIN